MKRIFTFVFITSLFVIHSFGATVADLISGIKSACDARDVSTITQFYGPTHSNLSPEELESWKHTFNLLNQGWTITNVFYNSKEEFLKRSPNDAKDILASYEEPIVIGTTRYTLSSPVVGSLFIEKTSKDKKMTSVGVLPVGYSNDKGHFLVYPMKVQAQQDAAANP